MKKQECEICRLDYLDNLTHEEAKEEVEYLKENGRCSCCKEEYGDILFPDQI